MIKTIMEGKKVPEKDPVVIGARARVKQTRSEELAQKRAGLSSRMETRLQSRQDSRFRPLRGLSDAELGALWEEADQPNAAGHAGRVTSGDIIRERGIRERERGGR